MIYDNWDDDDVERDIMISENKHEWDYFIY